MLQSSTPKTSFPHPFIPYFTTSRYRVETMIELAHINPGEIAADLGSGDGRILIALAEKGVTAHGYELDDQLFVQTKETIAKTRLGNNIVLHQSNFWEEDLSVYDIITVYPMPDIMEYLEKKLLQEAKPTTRILLNYYPFPTWKEVSNKDHIYLYKK